ncbi:MAG TPA: aspartyl protease family protein, partial [Sphingomonas sp.]|nr:aspartyl protease family protein [Sphingomonas sp.]
GRRPAAQSGQERYGGVIRRALAGGLAVAAAWMPALAQAPESAPPPAPPEQLFIKPATIDNTLEVVGETVAARQVNSRILIRVLIDGKGPFRFFVDSGADRSVIGEALAFRLGLPAGPNVLLHSTSSAREIRTAKIDSLSVGGSVIRDIAAPALPERFLGADGMLGIDALTDQRLTIDFDAKSITVQDTHRPEPAVGRDEVVITARRRKGQLILTQAYAGTPVAAVIDTGTEITVGNDALRERLMRHRRRFPLIKTTLMSVTGDETPADLISVPEIRIGDLTLRDVTIAFADVPPFKLFGLDKEPAILLGTDILQSFRRVSLDFRRRKVRFTLRSRR